MKVEAVCRIYKGKDVLVCLPTSFGKSVRYEVLSFACMTVNKASEEHVGRVARQLSWYSCCWYHIHFFGLGEHCLVVAILSLYIITSEYPHGQATHMLQL